MKKLTTLILLGLALLLSLPLVTGPVLAENPKMTTQEDVKAGELSDEHKVDEELAKTLVINKDAKSLNAEEREKGYKLYYPLGIKYLVPAVIEDCPNSKRRYNGMDNKEDNLIYQSREHFFRANAEITLSKDLYELEDKEEMTRRYEEEVLSKDRPLFGVFVLNKAQVPEDPAELAEKLGFYELDKVLEDEEKGRVTYFAWGRMNEEGLDGEDLENYRKIYAAIPEVRASCVFFPAAKPDESFAEEVESWAFEAETLDGESLSSADYFAKASGTVAMYWATWCPDCHNQMKEFKKIEEIAKLKDVQFLGIVSDLMQDDPKEDVIKAAHEAIDASELEAAIFTNIRYTLQMEDELFKRCFSWPTLLIFDNEGNLIKAYAKEAEAFEEDLLRDIADIIAYNKAKGGKE